MKDKNKICVKVYFNSKTFPEVIKDAEQTGKRRRGLQNFTQKEHGFADEMVSNTDGISRFLKFCWQYWKEHETDRLRKAIELAEREKQLLEEKKRLGIV